MLIPLHYVKRWYSVNHPVYKSFKYFFQNELWQKAVPQGMAVCPFTWMSLFSLVILRPFIAAVRLTVWTARVCRLSKALAFSDRTVSKISFISATNLGARTIGALPWISMPIFFFCLGHHSSVEGIYVVPILMIALGFIFLFSSLHDRLRLTTRRTKQLQLSVIPLALVAIGFAHWAECQMVLSALGHLIITICHWFLSSADSTWDWCVDQMVYLMLIWKWVLGFAIFWGAAALWMWNYDPTHTYAESQYLNARLYRKRAAILKVIAQHVNDKYDNDDNVWFKRTMKSRAAWDIVQQVVDSIAWLDIDMSRLNLSVSVERMDQVAEAVQAEFEAEIALAAAQREATQTQWTKTKVWFKHTYLHYWITQSWKFLRWIGRGIRIVSHNIMTFLCVVWELVKAKKAGFCPYLVFQNPDNHEVAPGAGGGI